MPDGLETLRLKEQAEENIYFARLDRELIKALRRKRAPSEETALPMPKEAVPAASDSETGKG